MGAAGEVAGVSNAVKKGGCYNFPTNIGNEHLGRSRAEFSCGTRLKVGAFCWQGEGP